MHDNLLGRRVCKAAGVLFIQMNYVKAASNTEPQSEPVAATMDVIVAPALRKSTGSFSDP